MSAAIVRRDLDSPDPEVRRRAVSVIPDLYAVFYWCEYDGHFICVGIIAVLDEFGQGHVRLPDKTLP